ncbi:SCP2 sterol-binding domain-containing protein [Tsukamurella sp. 8F]|uniref:SCP2 sterol-binding domain-containing protein n=1 Tax=unclassified Tsukamurella TaxID=2633480 RepID=UPI0023BA1CE7|nr:MULTISPECIES: SCP2 sterol-binding domain-containing protein [unclassified Tsukamurella]MDF0531683.1 SCP2 sterol-binding domain-containing protein [Tsukamurella sp. 8J]MDF0588929.1 SCP2 sterol-binding domain-containing protein [Tsukamurella sp. 8F]
MTLTMAGFFEELPSRFKPEEAADLQRTIQWHITDDEQGLWAFEIKDGKGHVIPGGVSEPDTTFTTTSDTWIAIAEGRQDAMKAFLTGKIQVEGDMTLALKVPDLFDTTVESAE